MKWISAEEKLPSDGNDYNLETVLVFTQRTDRIDDNHIFTAHYNNNEWLCDSVDKLKYCYSDKDIISGLHKVTHWMPLPEPPLTS